MSESNNTNYEFPILIKGLINSKEHVLDCKLEESNSDFFPYQIVSREGYVAFLISPNYGLGLDWSANFIKWNRYDPLAKQKQLQLMLDSRLVIPIGTGSPKSEFIEALHLVGLGEHIHGWNRGNKLVVQFLQKGTKFQIREYEGCEYVLLYKDNDWITL